MTKVLDCDILVNKCEHQESYYLYSRTNTLAKGMKPLIPAIYIYIYIERERERDM